MKYSLAVCLLLGLVKAAPEEELVTQLPDYDPFDSFKAYSGYVDLEGTSKKIHYMLVESEQDPANDPLIIWFNGGPGCSSMLAFMQENGPYKWEDGATKMVKNDYSWNREANVLYVEQPAGVGFSYCKDKSDGGECSFDDNNASEDNMKAILGWFEKFPEFKESEVYLAGESYAGIYVPFLLNQLHHHKQQHLTDPTVFKPNLKGMMVGNGVTNWNYDTFPALFEMGYWHSLIDKATYDKAKALNCDFSGLNFGLPLEEGCNEVVNKFSAAIDKVNIYDILGTCYGLEAEDGSHENFYQTHERGLKAVGASIKSYKKVMTAQDYTPWLYRGLANPDRAHGPATVVSSTPPCVYGQPLTEYLNRNDVRESLHIPDEIQGWEMCSDIDYTSLPRGSQWIWEGLKNEYRMLKFSGDTDGAVPTTGSIMWIESMGRDVLEAWRKYYHTEKEVKTLGGYIVEYDGLTFGTVHGAGHMAPQFKPAATYHLIFQWLKQEAI